MSKEEKNARPMKIHSPVIVVEEGSVAGGLRSGFGHRSVHDAALIDCAAASIFEAGRKAKRIVEICCGYGDLLKALANAFSEAEVTGVDQFEGTVERAREKIAGVRNAEVVVGDVMRMEKIDDESVDFVCGQACMHHLTHNLKSAFDEFHRILKPGGKCIFTFEPLSHNHIVNAVRSYRNAKMLLIDESNLYLETLEQSGERFSDIEVQCFNLTLGYLMKAFPSKPLFSKLSSGVRRYEAFRFKRSRRALRKAANFNAVFTK